MKLEITTRGDREIAYTRTFDAPRELVYTAYTEPRYVTQWLGVMPGWEWAECEMDVREGGRYRWVWRNAEQGIAMGCSGTFLEVTPLARLVQNETWDEPWYEGACVSTVTFEDRDGATLFTMVTRYDSAAVRDAVLAGPASEGVGVSFEHLATLLAGIAPRGAGTTPA